MTPRHGSAEPKSSPSPTVTARDADPDIRPKLSAYLDLLAKYEEGSKLLKVCESRLKDAELKIEKLKNTKEGAPAFEAFESTRAE